LVFDGASACVRLLLGVVVLLVQPEQEMTKEQGPPFGEGFSLAVGCS
jgi:hypothetical protein